MEKLGIKFKEREIEQEYTSVRRSRSFLVFLVRIFQRKFKMHSLFAFSYSYIAAFGLESKG
jgi:hypothetical protein